MPQTEQIVILTRTREGLSRVMRTSLLLLLLMLVTARDLPDDDDHDDDDDDDEAEETSNEFKSCSFQALRSHCFEPLYAGLTRGFQQSAERWQKIRPCGATVT